MTTARPRAAPAEGIIDRAVDNVVSRPAPSAPPPPRSRSGGSTPSANNQTRRRSTWSAPGRKHGAASAPTRCSREQETDVRCPCPPVAATRLHLGRGRKSSVFDPSSPLAPAAVLTGARYSRPCRASTWPAPSSRPMSPSILRESRRTHEAQGSAKTISASPLGTPRAPGAKPLTQPPHPTGTATYCLPLTL